MADKAFRLHHKNQPSFRCAALRLFFRRTWALGLQANFEVLLTRRPFQLAVLAFSVFSPQTRAATHHTDAYLQKCVEADSSTAGMSNCTSDAYSLWGKELNATYANLLGRLSASKIAVRNSQRQWIAFRDVEFKAIDAIYTNKDGTMYIPMRVGERLEIVRSRAMQLNGYLAAFKD